MRKLMWVFFGVSAVLLSHAVGMSFDGDAAVADEARYGDAELLAAWERGRQHGRAELLPTVRAAWQAGLDEAGSRCPMNAAVQP